MSQELLFGTRDKQNKNNQVDLCYWCTSVARGVISDEFHYTEEQKIIDKVKLKDAIDFLKYEIKTEKEKITECKNEIKSLMNIRKYREFSENERWEYAETKQCIDEYKENISLYKSMINKFEFLINILEINDNIEIWYINC